MNNGLPRILMIRLSAIGDVVRALPALHALRRNYPHAQIDWVIERKSLDIVSGHPDLDKVWVFERSSSRWDSAKRFWKLCRDIRRARYDIVLDFHGIAKSGLLTLYSGVPVRYGFARPRAQELSWLSTNRKVKLESNRLNRVEENLLLTDALGERPVEVETRISVPHDVQDSVDEYIEQTFEGGKRLVVMHAPVERPEKQWPLEHFARLADLLIADGRFDVVLTWGPGQFELVQTVAQLARRNPRIAPETPDLKHFAWLVHRASLYFGGDTGPMHIAWTMGTPVVAVFGGTDPEKHAPYRGPSEILRADPMQTITPDEAYDACVKMIGAIPRVHRG